MRESSSVTQARLHATSDEEPGRVQCLDDLGILDAGNGDLDLLTRRAARVMGTAVGAISALRHDEQQLIASTGTNEGRTDRATSFCTHVAARRRPLVVGDATRDPFFAANPRVGLDGDATRSYCGVPIVIGDHVVAVLCARDSRPRTFDDAQVETLLELARCVPAMLVPHRTLPPTVPARRPQGAPTDGWCQEDPLRAWIERTVPDEEALAREAARRRRTWWRRDRGATS